MLKVGIDSISFYTSHYSYDLKDLARVRAVDPDKYSIGIGQQTMAVPPPGEDIVTMAANAAERATRHMDLNSIELLLFATESGIDQSKAAGVYVHELLGLGERCRVVELKQACYAGTASLQLGLAFLHQNPDKKVLVIASDVARYGLGVPAEPTQGCGAVAMVLSVNPRIMAFDSPYGVVTESVMDFWRPNYLDVGLVDGKSSTRLYLNLLEKCWLQYSALSHRQFKDHDYFCYHVPLARLAEKGHAHLSKINGESSDEKKISSSLEYSRQIGNSYTASLYVSLISLLDHASEDLTDKRVGFYSYGSGCVAEYFSGVVQPGYQKMLETEFHQRMLADRESLTYSQYENFFSYELPKDGSRAELPYYNTGNFRLTRMEDHKRMYEKTIKKKIFANDEKSDFRHVRVLAPGKLILSGEHAVVYGKPAVAMAINRYVVATAKPEMAEHISFNLADLSYEDSLSLSTLTRLKNRLKDKYQCFVHGDFKIREVLQKPVELAQFALSIFMEMVNIKLTQGINIRVESDIPIGCGMGSSAATVLSIMHAIAHHFEMDVSPEMFFRLGLEAEKLQHGFSTGLDLRASLHGGCIYIKEGQIQQREAPTMPMYLINTGTPQSSTGDCVTAVACHFKETNIGDDFESVTNAMDAALQNQKTHDILHAMRANHDLLVKIGVVPTKVQQFIHEIQKRNGAAKICGAGSVSGDQGGIVLVMAESELDLTDLCQRYQYSMLPIRCEPRGVHVV